MNRRALLSLRLSANDAVGPRGAFATPAPATVTGLEPYTGPWEIPQVAHLLRRLMFGARWADMLHFREMSPAEAVDQLLSPTAPPPPQPVNDYNSEEYTDPVVPFGAPWLNAAHDNEAEGYRIWSLKAWWFGNLVEQDLSIREKMILFWHNHMPVEFYGVFSGRWNYRYLSTLRQHALGNFRALIRAITLDPAMLHYLNGQYNSVWAPDENYARELQELFCIGKGPNSRYTEEDVQAAARILTGWRVTPGDAVTFVPWEHDSQDKQFSSFYGNALIKGRSGAAGAEELDELLDMILANEECALFLCRKIYRFFLYHQIDTLTEEQVIAPLAQILRDHDYDILPVLSVLFKSQHFFDQLTRGAMLKGPMDFLAGLYRTFNTPIPDRSMLSDRFQHNDTLVWFGGLLQQDLGEPPNVAGWPAYHQAPVFDRSWITTDTLPRRAQFTDWILWAGVSTEQFLSQLDIFTTVAQMPDPGDPNALINDLLSWLFGIEPPLALKAQLKAILLSGQLSDYYWTVAWQEYIANPADDMKRDVVRNRLLAFFYTLLHREEYQLL